MGNGPEFVNLEATSTPACHGAINIPPHPIGRLVAFESPVSGGGGDLWWGDLHQRAFKGACRTV